MEHAAAIGDEDETVVNGGSGEDVFLERVAPDECVGGAAAGFCGVNALEPGFVLPPPKIAAASEVDAVFIEDGHVVEIARAFAAIAEIAVDVLLTSGGIEF